MLRITTRKSTVNRTNSLSIRKLRRPKRMRNNVIPLCNKINNRSSLNSALVLRTIRRFFCTRLFQTPTVRKKSNTIRRIVRPIVTTTTLGDRRIPKVLRRTGRAPVTTEITTSKASITIHRVTTRQTFIGELPHLDRDINGNLNILVKRVRRVGHRTDNKLTTGAQRTLRLLNGLVRYRGQVNRAPPLEASPTSSSHQ